MVQFCTCISVTPCSYMYINLLMSVYNIVSLRCYVMNMCCEYNKITCIQLHIGYICLRIHVYTNA